MGKWDFLLDFHVITWYNYIIKKREEVIGMRDSEKRVQELVKLVRSLTQLALEIGTLIAVIKMIVESIQ